MFVLPNGAAVDVEGVFDAFEDPGDDTVYFLDTMTGDVGTVALPEEKEKVAALETNERYIEIPGIDPDMPLVWMEEFIEDVLSEGESELADALKQLISQTSAETALEACEALLAQVPGNWLDQWDDWYEDRLLDQLDDWFKSLPIKIEEKPCGKCDECKREQELNGEDAE